jgi:endonuclease/exonuclease/phosphatase family metal-dependent hydrolase
MTFTFRIAKAAGAVLLAGLPACAGIEPSPAGAGEQCPPAMLPSFARVAAPDAADHAVLDAWCAGVGPAVVRRQDTPSGPRASADSVLVVTWNTRVGGGDIGRFVSQLRRGRLTAGEPVQHFVLLIQEAHRGGAAVPGLVSAGARGAARITASPPTGGRQDIVATAEQLDLNLIYVPSMRNGAGVPAEDRGNAILSTLPLTDATAIELPFEAQRRVAAAANVEVVDASGRQWSLRVASAHLDNRSRLGRGLATFGPARARQAEALVDALAADTFAVLGGDLNTWFLDVAETAPRILRRAFADTPPGDGLPTHSAGPLRRRLDDLFFRGAGSVMSPPVRIEERYGSDHHPLVGWVRFGGRG